MTLSAAAQDLIGRLPLGFVATVTPEGRPSVSPKGTFLVLDDQTLAFGEIRSPKTLANLAHLPECEVNFVDPFTRKGVRVRASTRRVLRGSDAFNALIPQWIAVCGALADRINELVVLSVIDSQELSTPPYDDGVTEAEMIALYKQKYADLYP